MKKQLCWLYTLRKVLITAASLVIGAGLVMAQESQDPLIIALGTEPDQLDLHVDFGINAERIVLGGNVMERLVRPDEEGNPEPVLATEWEQVDDLTWRFHLRQGVTFHDGTELTAEDVIASVYRILDPVIGARANELAGLVGAEAVDEFTVDLKTEAYDPILLNRLSYLVIMPSEQIEERPDEIAIRPIGTGPYRFVEWERGQYIQLEKVPSYWGDYGTLPETVRYVWRNEPSVRLAALQAGEVDVALGLPPNLARQAPATFETTGTEHLMLRINTYAEPTASPEVREAISLAINRDGLVTGVFQEAATKLGSFGTPSFVTEYRSEFDHPLPYDPELARQLIQSQGAQGARITVLGPATGPWFSIREATEAVGAMLSAVGFNVDLQIVSFDEWIQNLYWELPQKEQAPHVMIIPTSTDLLTIDQPYRAYLTCNQRLSLYCNENVEEMFSQLTQVQDPEERAQIYGRISEQALHQDRGFLPIATLETFAGAREGIRVNLRPLPDVFIWDIELGAEN